MHDNITASTRPAKPPQDNIPKTKQQRNQLAQLVREYVESKGRDEENPLSPRYKEAIEEYLADIGNATTDVCVLRGTELVERPDDILDPDSDEWALEMDVLGLPMSDNSKARYLNWVKYIAAPLNNDINLLMAGVGRLTGVSEADVLEAVQRFRR